MTTLIVGFNAFVLVYFMLLNTSYLVLFLLSLRGVFRFTRRTFFSDYRQIMQSEMRPRRPNAFGRATRIQLFPPPHADCTHRVFDRRVSNSQTRRVR